MTELKLSPIVAGAWRMAGWQMNAQQRLVWINACLERGFSSFDHADIYGGYQVEALFGEALALASGLRERMQLVSKCGIQLVTPARPGNAIKHYDTSAAHVQASVENSLKSLRTDHLDLLLIHCRCLRRAVSASGRQPRRHVGYGKSIWLRSPSG